jgi:hypothetical protein
MGNGEEGWCLGGRLRVFASAGVRAQVQIGGRSGLGFASAGRENTHGYLRGWGVAIKIEVLRNEGIRDGIE